jgi:hypothetical protein
MTVRRIRRNLVRLYLVMRISSIVLTFSFLLVLGGCAVNPVSSVVETNEIELRRCASLLPPSTEWTHIQSPPMQEKKELSRLLLPTTAMNSSLSALKVAWFVSAGGASYSACTTYGPTCNEVTFTAVAEKFQMPPLGGRSEKPWWFLANSEISLSPCVH